MNALEQRLAELVGIPGISASSYPASDVRRSADAVAETLLEFGLHGVRLLETEGHPAVFGEKHAGDDAKTVLIYGHHDVQPPGCMERWLSPPFAATIRDGRMYGRGTSDDKGGFLAQLAAVQSSELRVNVKMLIEGEEEIGSPHLGALLDAHRDLFACDVIVLCDTPNFDTGVPALTYRLRGNCIVDVEVRCLERPLHSGQAGGLAPDASMVLCQLLARLDTLRWDAAGDASARELPFDRDDVRRDFGLLEGVDVLASSWEDVWAKPSIAITALEAIPLAQAANQLAHAARARISIRTVRGVEDPGPRVAELLQSDVPHHAQVHVTVRGGPRPWEADTTHPLFGKVRRALAKGYGHDAVLMGSGGSIGFVAPFAALAGANPPLLTGVQDRRSNAHSENESLHLGDWQKAIRAASYLLEELAS